MVKATWKHLTTSPSLQRSSHSISAIDQTLYIFGGELKPREPRDNDLFSINLASADSTISTVSISSTAPLPRVGTASTTLGNKIYLFSGRGGPSMSPIEENGALWCFDRAATSWSLVTPANSSAEFPPTRSYHCMTSDPTANVVYLHAGCPASGRLADLWGFDLGARTWTRLPDAPGPARGGASIVYAGGALYRMNGFDGKTEQGGAIDIFDVGKGEWSSKAFTPGGVEGPEARSVGCLLAVRVGGRDCLVTMFGERDPSSLGHAGAGKMLGDAWMFDVLDARWVRVEAQGDQPAARGWFDADVIGGDKIVVAGGLSETNERLSDVWKLEFE